MRKFICFFLFTFVVKIGFTQNFEKIDLLLLKGNFADAIQLIDNQLLADSTSGILYRKAIAHQALMQYDVALPFAIKAAKAEPQNTDYKAVLAKNYNELDMFVNAKQTYIEILKTDSTHLNAKTNLAKLYLNNADFENALLVYSQLSAKDTANSYFYHQIGFCYRRLNEPVHAIVFFDKAYSLNPENLSAIKNLSALYFDIKKYDKAMELTDAGLALDSTDLSLVKRKANLFYTLKKFEDAIVYYKKLLQRGDSSYFNLYFAGLCYYFADKFEFKTEAASLLEKAYTQDSTDKVLCSYLGRAMHRAFEYDKAGYYLNKAIELNMPDTSFFVDTYDYMIDLYNNDNYKEKQLEVALQRFKYQQDSKTANKIAYLYAYASQKKEALKYIEIFEQLLINEKVDRYGYSYILADLYEKIGEKQKAIVQYEKYLKEIEKTNSTDEGFQKHIEGIRVKIGKLKADVHFEGN